MLTTVQLCTVLIKKFSVSEAPSRLVAKSDHHQLIWNTGPTITPQLELTAGRMVQLSTRRTLESHKQFPDISCCS